MNFPTYKILSLGEIYIDRVKRAGIDHCNKLERGLYIKQTTLAKH